MDSRPRVSPSWLWETPSPAGYLGRGEEETRTVRSVAVAVDQLWAWVQRIASSSAACNPLAFALDTPTRGWMRALKGCSEVLCS